MKFREKNRRLLQKRGEIYIYVYEKEGRDEKERRGERVKKRKKKEKRKKKGGREGKGIEMYLLYLDDMKGEKDKYGWSEEKRRGEI